MEQLTNPIKNELMDTLKERTSFSVNLEGWPAAIAILGISAAVTLSTYFAVVYGTQYNQENILLEGV